MHVSFKAPSISVIALILVFMVLVGGRAGVVHAQTTGCYTYQPSSGSTVSVDLTTSSGQTSTITIPNQNPPSILQEIDFNNSDSSCTYSYYSDDSLGLNFLTNSGTLAFAGFPEPMSHEDASVAQIYPANYSDWLSGNFSIWFDGFSYYGLSDIASAANEDAIINTIGSTGQFSMQSTVINPYTSPLVQNMSVAATNCVSLLGNGPRKVVFMRGNSLDPTVGSPTSASDFLAEVNATLGILKSVDPYKTYWNQFSFYADLKKVNDTNLPLIGYTGGGDAGIWNGVTSGYIYNVDPTGNVFTSSCANGSSETDAVIIKDASMFNSWTSQFGKTIFLNDQSYSSSAGSIAMPLARQLAKSIGGLNSENVVASTGDFNTPFVLGGHTLTEWGTNCTTDPGNDYRGPDNNLYGSVADQGCKYLNGTASIRPPHYYRPSNKSIMSDLPTTIPVVPDGTDNSKFNIVSCGYIVAGLNGQAVTQTNAATHFAECSHLDVAGKAELPVNSKSPVVITVGGFSAGGLISVANDIFGWTNIFSWMDAILPTEVSSIHVPTNAHSSANLTSTVVQDVNNALAQGRPAIVVGYSLGSFVAFNIRNNFPGQNVQFIYVDPPYKYSPFFAGFARAFNQGFFSSSVSAIKNGIATDPNSVIWTNGEAMSNLKHHDPFYYADSSIAPNGLSNQTNLNNLQDVILDDLGQASISTASFSPIANATPSSPNVILTGIESGGNLVTSIAPGDTVSLTGTGFDPNANDIHIEDVNDPTVYYDFSSYAPDSNGNLTFTLPPYYDLSDSGGAPDTISDTYTIQVAGYASNWSNIGTVQVTSTSVPPPVPGAITNDPNVPNQYILAGSGYSATGNSVGLTAQSVAMTMPKMGVFNVAAALGGFWQGLFANKTSTTSSQLSVSTGATKTALSQVTTKATVQTASSVTPNYIITGLSGTGSSVTFKVPSTVPNGTYTVSVRSLNTPWVTTTNTVTVSGSISGVGPTSISSGLGTGTGGGGTTSTTCPSGYTLSGSTCAPVSTGSLPTSLAGIPVSSIAATQNTVITYLDPYNTNISGNGGCSAFGGVLIPNPGQSISGITTDKTQVCQVTTTSYSCPAHYVVSGTMCNPNPAYTCPVGYSLSGSTCNPNLSLIGFTAQAGTTSNIGKVLLSWSNPGPGYAGATGITIEHALSPTGPWSPLLFAINMAPYTVSAIDNGFDSGGAGLIDPGTTVYYRAYARFNSVIGPYTNVVSAVTPSVAVPVLTATTTGATAGTIKLTWSGDPRNQYYVYTASSSNPIASVASNSYIYTTSSFNVNYCFEVAVYDNATYESSASNIACVATSNFPAPVLPSVSSAITTTKKNTSGQIVTNSKTTQGLIVLTGQTPISLGTSTVPTISALLVERSTLPTSGFVQVAIDTDPSLLNTEIITQVCYAFCGTKYARYTPTPTVMQAQWQYVDTIVPPSTSLYYRLRFKTSEGGLSDYSSVMSATSATPSAPILSIKTKAETSLELSWTINTKIDNGNPSITINSSATSTPLTTLASTTLSYTVSNLVPSTQYCYTVNLIYNPVNITPSTQVCATTSKSTAPANLSAKASGQSVALAWKTAGSVSLERSISKADGFIQVTSTSSTSYTDSSGLAPATAYYYRVRKIYSDGSLGVYSNVVSAKTAVASTKAMTATSNVAVQDGAPVATDTSPTTNMISPTKTSPLTPAQILQNLLNGNKKQSTTETTIIATTSVNDTLPSSLDTIPAQTSSSVPATVTYTCATSSYVLSGSQCTLTTTISATAQKVCPAGYSVISQTCVRTIPPSILALTTSYTCPNGYTLSGNTCTSTSVTVPATATYSCPTGFSLDNTTKTCTQPVSDAFATSTTTASVFDSMVGWMTGLFR